MAKGTFNIECYECYVKIAAVVDDEEYLVLPRDCEWVKVDDETGELLVGHKLCG